MARYGSRVIATIALITACLAKDPDQLNLAARISHAESLRDAKVEEVRSVRRYTVRNARWKSDSTMEARMITLGDGSKRYEVLKMNAEGMRKKIFLRILDGEVQAAARSDRDGNVNAINYELRPTPDRVVSGQTCRSVQLVPKKRSRFIFEGSGCVDMTDLAMVRMEGRTTKNVSFLVGRAYVVQEFRKIGEFWYSSLNHSTADVRFLGRTELIIEYVDYSITPKSAALITACGGSRCSQSESK